MKRLYYLLFAVTSNEKAYVRGKRLEAIFGLALFVLMAIGCTLVSDSHLLDGGGRRGSLYIVRKSVDCIIFYLCIGFTIISAIYLLRDSLGYLSRVDYSAIDVFESVNSKYNVKDIHSKRIECWLGILLYVISFVVLCAIFDDFNHQLFIVGWFIVAASYLMKNNMRYLFHIMTEEEYAAKTKKQRKVEVNVANFDDAEQLVRNSMRTRFEKDLRKVMDGLTGDSLSDGLLLQTAIVQTYKQLKNMDENIKEICWRYHLQYDRILDEEYQCFYDRCFENPKSLEI